MGIFRKNLNYFQKDYFFLNQTKGRMSKQDLFHDITYPKRFKIINTSFDDQN
jgi:hypothetical protein